MTDTKKDEMDANLKQNLEEIYGSEEEYVFARTTIKQINDDLERREQPSPVTNGVPYSQAYAYNQRKAVNYAPPRDPKDDREVSLGIVHEKIVSFIAIFLKYVFKRRIKCYNEKGELIRGLGRIYDLAIEFSYEVEKLARKIALIYWETYTQGDAFVFEDWEVKMKSQKKAYIMENGEKKYIDPDAMDYSLEFLDNLQYDDDEPIQTRRAVSRVLDGRTVIPGDVEIEEVQEQPRITIELDVSKAVAEALLGSLKRWKNVPKEVKDIKDIAGDMKTLFNGARLKDPKNRYLLHFIFDKENNLYNVFCNGLMMLPSNTPMTIFYPRGNYPISKVSAERVRGSFYSRSIPAKTKFNADFIDWALKKIAQKFEQGIEPPLLANGKYTLTRAMWRGGQVTHGVKKEDFDKVDPDNKGVTQSEFNLFSVFKEIIESQTVNQTYSGEISGNATATEIGVVDSNQRKKLALLLDGLITGFMDMALRRAETIECKYTLKQKETYVDGKKVNVYQNFSINVSGIEKMVSFDDEVGSPDYDEKGARARLFKQAHDDRKKGYATEYYLANPRLLRYGRPVIIMEIVPEQVKDTQLQMIQMWDEFTQLINIFGRSDQGGEVDIDELKKEYLDVSGRPDELFTSKLYKQLDKRVEGEGSPYKQGSFGKPNTPTVGDASKQAIGMKQ